MTADQFHEKMEEQFWWWADATCRDRAWKIYYDLWILSDDEKAFDVVSSLISLGAGQFGA